MPKIPVYERRFDERSVNLNAPMQNINAPADAFGAGNARALQGLGQNINELGRNLLAAAERRQKEEDELAVTKAYGDYHNRVSNYLVGDGSPGSGAYGRLGGSALGLTKEAKEKLREMEREASAGLTPQQQQAFGLKAMAVSRESLVGVARHESAERRKDLINTYQSVAKREADYALLNYTDADKVNAGVARMEENLRLAAQYSGISPEQTEELVRLGKSDTVKNVALRYVKNGQYGVAREIMNDDRMTGEDKARVMDALRPAEVADKADALAEMLTAKGFDKQSAQKYLMDNVEDLDVRRVAKQTFNALYATRKAEAAQARQEAIYNAMDQIDALEGNLAAQYKLLQSMPEGPVKAAASRRYREYAKFEGLDFMTSPDDFVDLQEAISVAEITTPQALREDPRAAKISAAKIKDLERQLQGKQKIDRDMLKASYLQAKGLQVMPTGSSTKADYYQFQLWADKMAADTNRADDPVFYQKLADAWTLKGEKKGGGLFYGANLDFRKGKDEPTWLPDIPDEAAQTKVKEAFAAYPDMKREYIEAYGSEKLAMRGYYFDLIKNGLGPVQRTKE